MVKKSKKYLINTVLFFSLTIFGVLIECSLIQKIQSSMSFFLCFELILGVIDIIALIICTESFFKYYLIQKKLEKRLIIMDVLTEQINPILFSEYLQKKGWKIFPRKEGYLKVFQYYSPDGKMYQVVIPLDKTLSDYDYAMAEAVETVAFVEGRTVEQVVENFRS